MSKTFNFVAYVILIVSLVACATVAYAALWLQDTAREVGANTLSAEQKTAEAAYLSRLKSLAGETAAERDRLESIASADLVAIAESIEVAGEDAGVIARVNTALPSGDSRELPDGGKLEGIAFIVQAEGSFSGLVRFARSLESFPGISSVHQFEFERAQLAGGTSAPWRASVRLEIFTTLDIAS